MFLKYHQLHLNMLYIKDGYPEVNEIVYTTVRKIYGNTVFVYLDEYDKEGVLTISEIAPGRIRNMRDYVVEDKKIVCKVLRVDPKQKRIDVSLRRVSVPLMKKKLDEIKKEGYAEKLYEDVSKELSMTKDELFEKTYEPIFEEFETVFEALYEIMLENDKISMFTELNPQQREVLLKHINDSIKPEEVTLKKSFTIYSDKKEGVDEVKEAIKEAIDATKYDKIHVFYKAAGNFGINITHDEMKLADKVFIKFKDTLEKQAKQKKINVNFQN